MPSKSLALFGHPSVLLPLWVQVVSGEAHTPRRKEVGTQEPEIPTITIVEKAIWVRRLELNKILETCIKVWNGRAIIPDSTRVLYSETTKFGVYLSLLTIPLTPIHPSSLATTHSWVKLLTTVKHADNCGLELELIQTQMTKKPMLRAEVYAHAMRASQNRKKGSA